MPASATAWVSISASSSGEQSAFAGVMLTATSTVYTALLVIDVQNDVVAAAHERDAVVGRIRGLGTAAAQRRGQYRAQQRNEEADDRNGRRDAVFIEIRARQTRDAADVHQSRHAQVQIAALLGQDLAVRAEGHAHALADRLLNQDNDRIHAQSAFLLPRSFTEKLMKNSQPSTKNSMMPVTISETFSLRLNCEAIWLAPFCINTSA